MQGRESIVLMHERTCSRSPLFVSSAFLAGSGVLGSGVLPSRSPFPVVRFAVAVGVLFSGAFGVSGGVFPAGGDVRSAAPQTLLALATQPV